MFMFDDVYFKWAKSSELCITDSHRKVTDWSNAIDLSRSTKLHPFIAQTSVYLYYGQFCALVWEIVVHENAHLGEIVGS